MRPKEQRGKMLLRDREGITEMRNTDREEQGAPSITKTSTQVKQLRHKLLAQNLSDCNK